MSYQLGKFTGRAQIKRSVFTEVAASHRGKNRPVCFHQTQEIGFFAQLTYCVLTSKACREKGLEPYFFIENKLSVQPGLARNALQYYFDHVNFNKNTLHTCYRRVINGDSIAIRNRQDINRFLYGNPRKEVSNTLLTLEEGTGLFFSNLCIRKWLIDLVDDFWLRELSQYRVLGVHFRGTDKSIDEADRVSFEEVEAEITRHMQGIDKIFLASDEAAFYDFMKKSKFANALKFYSVPNHNLSHYFDIEKNFRKNAVAIIDCLLLSRCNALIKTPSSLSAWCKVFNPDLEVHTVGRPYEGAYGNFRDLGYGYWPEKCLHPLSSGGLSEIIRQAKIIRQALKLRISRRI